jgi:type II secretory pathway pseudopilin PulG
MEPTMHRHLHPRRPARGITLVEALVALLVLALGMLAVARLQPALRQHADDARQRSEALRLAQSDLERLRAYESAASGPRSHDAIAAHAEDVDGGYRLTREVDAAVLPHAKAVRVGVTWPDRSGATRHVALDSVIARIDPVLAGSTGLRAPGAAPVQGVAGRSAQIPTGAKDLGDGRSVYKPVVGGVGAIVFDNRSGSVTARCTVPAATPTEALVGTDLSACTHAHGMHVSGEIRFSGALPPDPRAANDTPLPLAVRLTLEGAAPPVAPWCSAQARKVVAYRWAGSEQVVAVPLDAEPAAYALVAWTDLGERLVAYHCVVVPPVGVGRWSGRTDVVPDGWTIGTDATHRRVCRYARDADGSGSIDANVEHPAIYQNVAAALTRQNFLVVRGDQTCPAPADTHATVPHQPDS